MFVLLLKIFLERTRLTRCLAICAGLLLVGHAALGGVYQRTKDGKTLVWNNFPAADDKVSWSGKRDAEGFATGKGTLIWYRADKNFQTGSMLPGRGGPVAVTTRYSGTMVRGKLNGPVRNVDADGKTFQLTFANGTKIHGRPLEPAPSESPHNGPVVETPKAPAEGPSPSPVVVQSPKPQPSKAPENPAPVPAASEDVALKPTPSPEPSTPVVEVASIHMTPAPAASSPSADDIDSAVK